MANPTPRPHTTPTKIITISFPNNGGNDNTNRIATGINHPHFSCCSFLTKGVNQLIICHQPSCTSSTSHRVCRQTYRMVKESHQGNHHNKQDKEDVIPYPLFPYPKPPITNLAPGQDTFLVLYSFFFRKFIVSWDGWVWLRHWVGPDLALR